MGPHDEFMSQYTVGERILCFHGPLLYEAKCINIQKKGSEVTYLVHYQGWNKTWDEWIEDSRMLKYDEDGLKRQKQLLDEARKKKKLMKIVDEKKNNVGEPGSDFGRKRIDDISSKKIEDSEKNKKKRKSKMNVEFDKLEVSTCTSSVPGDIEDPSTSHMRMSTGTSETSYSDGIKGEYLVKKEEEDAQVLVDQHISHSEVSSQSRLKSHSRVSSQRSSQNSRSKKSRLVPLDESIVDLECYAAELNVPTLKFTFPDKLRLWLADDGDLVNRQSRLSRMPPRISVDDLLIMYNKYCEEQVTDAENKFEFEKDFEMRMQLSEALRKYFNMCLGSVLLYKFERHQYLDLKRGNHNDPSTLYGPMFVLRLLVRLPKLMSYTRTDVVSIDCLNDLIHHFVEFLDIRSEELFRLEDYITATGEYIRRAMC